MIISAPGEQPLPAVAWNYEEVKAEVEASGLQNREMKVQVLPPVPSAPPARRSSPILCFSLLSVCWRGGSLK